MTTPTDWWAGACIYQVYPRSFQDSNGDGIGDLAGITQRLDHIASLGADAIWISPFFRSPMRDFGYDVTDYCDVDPMFGMLADFDALVARAHALKIKVLIDLVISHTSKDHPWFVESRTSRDNPKADWYVWVDPQRDGSPPNNWLSLFGGSAWQFDTRRQQYFMHNFLVSQPDLNFHEPQVQDAVLDAARFWLERGVDGFRLDTVNFYFHDRQLRSNPPQPPGQYAVGVPRANPYAMQRHLYDKTQPENLAFLQRFRALCDRFPGITTIGEIGDDNEYATLRAYTTGARLHMAYTFNLMTERHEPRYVHAVLAEMLAEAGDAWVCWALNNHDVVRVVTRWAGLGPAERVAPLLVGLLGSLRGSICLYQGEELGLPEAVIPFEQIQDPYGKEMWPEFVGRDGCRTPMPWSAAASNAGFTTGTPWLPMPDGQRRRAVDAQAPQPVSVLNRYRAFLNWRRAQPALRRGAMALLPAHDQVLAFTRGEGADQLLCAFNLSDRPARVAHGLPGSWTAVGGHGFGGRIGGAEIVLEPQEAVFARR